MDRVGNISFTDKPRPQQRKLTREEAENILKDKLSEKGNHNPSADEIEALMLKCRDLYLQDVYDQIDKFKIENMKRISQEKFEEVEVKADIFEDQDLARSLTGISDPNKLLNPKSVGQRISRCHQKLLSLERLFSKRNILIMGVVTYAFFAYLFPILLHAFHTYDAHYHGYFNERLPRLAMTTQEKRYFTEKNIPFMTIQELESDNEQERQKKI
mmetsp:Transcript_10168/g.17140  ORF Transcript_10168/g.17140 Transcript_10168/m.17140 type:complete len:214 (-) Transcript_10168:2460-3101(-)